MAKVLRSVYLDLEQVEKIKALSKATRIPQSEFIREGLDLLIKKYERRESEGEK